MGQDIARQESQFRQPKARRIGGDKLAMQTNHLFGRQRRVLNGPTVAVNVVERFGVERKVSS